MGSFSCSSKIWSDNGLFSLYASNIVIPVTLLPWTNSQKMLRPAWLQSSLWRYDEIPGEFVSQRFLYVGQFPLYSKIWSDDGLF